MAMSKSMTQNNTWNSGFVDGNPAPGMGYKLNNGLKTSAQRGKGFALLLAAVGGIVGTGAALAEPLVISAASWNDNHSRLAVSGSGTPQAAVSVVNACATSLVPGRDEAGRRHGRWSIRSAAPMPVPCCCRPGRIST